ncbi:MAG: histidine phosphatase family protein [Dehalococcoidia bacterium]|nr:histidine phosphatase family protein [Dehalococcoidia bacterium]
MTDPDRESWIVEQLSNLPDKADAALILRHAEREEIPQGTFGVDVPLTTSGVTSAERLGAILSGIRPLVYASASPVPRCVSTATAILRGGGWPEEVALDWRLGDPGPFVVDEEVSGALFLETGILEIVRHQLTLAEPPAGMRPTAEGINLLLGLTTNNLYSHGRLNIYVTHDAILAVLVAYLYRLRIDEINWPGYLDGLLLWRSGDRVNFIWRGLEQGSHPLGC